MTTAQGRNMLPPLRGLRLPWSCTACLQASSDWFLAERERWILWLPVLLGCGIAIYFSLPAEPPPWAGILSFAALLGLLALCRRIALPVSLPLLAMALIAGGFAIAQWRTASVAAPVLPRHAGPTLFDARIVAVESRPVGVRLLLRPLEPVDRAGTLPERVRITVRQGLQEPVGAGDIVSLRAMLMPPSAPVAPGAFDFARHAWFLRLGAVGYAIDHVRLVTDGASAGTLSLSDRLARMRLRIAERVRAAVPGQAGAVAAALLTGDRGAVSEQVLDDMRDSGLAHLLAISGLHLGLVAGSLFLALRLILASVPWLALRVPVKKCAALFSLLGALGYLLLAGAPVPTQRAFIMACCVVLAVVLDRKPFSMRLLAWAATAVLLLQPESLLSPGFQMSFAAVAGLIAVYEALAPYMRRRGRRLGRPLRYLAGIAVTTIVAGLATAPFAAFHFNQMTSYGLVANLVAVPLTALVVMPLGVLAVVLMPLGLHGLPLQPVGQALELILRLAGEVASWPGASHTVPAMPTWLLAVLAVAGLWFCLWHGRGRWAGVLVGAAGIVAAAAGASHRGTEILVAGDGRHFAVMTAGGELLLPTGATRGRTVETWLARWGVDPAAGLPDDRPVLNCDSLGCLHEADGLKIAFARKTAALTDDCRMADVVIASVPSRWRCRSPTLVVDRFALWRYGAHRIEFRDGKMSVETVAEVQGDRPWRAYRPPPQRPRPNSVAAMRSGGPES